MKPSGFGKMIGIAALALSASAAFAASLPIKGNYGNADGCAYASSGDVAGVAFELLQPDRFAVSKLSCNFKAVSLNSGGMRAQASCMVEENETAQDMELRIQKKQSGYAVYGPDKQLAEVKPCP